MVNFTGHEALSTQVRQYGSTALLAVSARLVTMQSMLRPARCKRRGQNVVANGGVAWRHLPSAGWRAEDATSFPAAP